MAGQLMHTFTINYPQPQLKRMGETGRHFSFNRAANYLYVPIIKGTETVTRSVSDWITRSASGPTTARISTSPPSEKNQWCREGARLLLKPLQTSAISINACAFGQHFLKTTPPKMKSWLTWLLVPLTSFDTWLPDCIMEWSLRRHNLVYVQTQGCENNGGKAWLFSFVTQLPL